MRILIITQYFWPENFKINSLSLELKNNGHDVIVLTGLPNYPSGKITSKYSFWKIIMKSGMILKFIDQNYYQDIQEKELIYS